MTKKQLELYFAAKELELSLTKQEKTILDYILNEFYSVDQSDSMTIDKLHELMMLIKEEFRVYPWSSAVDSNYKYASKEFCRILDSYLYHLADSN